MKATCSLSHVAAVFAAAVICSATAVGGGKVGIHGIYMTPDGVDAERFSRAGWGLGVHVLWSPEAFSDVFGPTLGLEYVNLLSKRDTFWDRVTGLRSEQQTEQAYGRLSLGMQVGGLGNSLFRPYAGVHIALIVYGISTDVVIPDDYDREKEIRQSLRSETKACFGYDFTFGLDVNISRNISIDGGIRYLKSFSVPQQLGDGSVKIHPQYFQVFLGAALSFDIFGE